MANWAAAKLRELKEMQVDVVGEMRELLSDAAETFRGDRYQTGGSPHNRERAATLERPARDTTEVTVMPGQFSSGDTDDGARLVGAEDDAGRAWCLACIDAEIRQGGATPFVFDLYVTTSPGTARRKCANCRRPIGEVAGG